MSVDFLLVSLKKEKKATGLLVFVIAQIKYQIILYELLVILQVHVIMDAGLLTTSLHAEYMTWNLYFNKAHNNKSNYIERKQTAGGGRQCTFSHIIKSPHSLSRYRTCYCNWKLLFLYEYFVLCKTDSGYRLSTKLINRNLLITRCKLHMHFCTEFFGL